MKLSKIFFGIALLVTMAVAVFSFVLSSVESSITDLKLANTEVLARGEVFYERFCFTAPPSQVIRIEYDDFVNNKSDYPGYSYTFYCGDCNQYAFVIVDEYFCLRP